MKDLQEILNHLPDKWESKTTTSKKWKEGLYTFCKNNDIRSILEIGTSLGHTTYFVAHFADKVTTVELDQSRVNKASKLSKKHSNINFVCQSAYGTEWNFGYHDLTIIDCIHEYKYVKMDIDNAIRLGTKYIAFDDYGLFPEIKKAIDEYVSGRKLEVVTRIGYPTGTHFHMSKSTNTTPDKVLVDFEGIICKVV
jgi:SAM-dependent methyltransferase